MPITGSNTDTYSDSGTNLFNDPDPLVTGHRHIGVVIRIMFQTARDT
jgi:hypothetical protein